MLVVVEAGAIVESSGRIKLPSPSGMLTSDSILATVDVLFKVDPGVGLTSNLGGGVEFIVLG